MSKHRNKATLWLMIATAAYFAMNGAQIWETALFVPAWTAAPPESLVFLRGPHSPNLKIFWIIMHSIHEVFLLIALVFNLKIKNRRNAMLALTALHIILRVWTLQYFAPTITEFQAIEETQGISIALVEKAAQWRNLNYLRVGLYLMINIGFALLLTKPVSRTS